MVAPTFVRKLCIASLALCKIMLSLTLIYISSDRTSTLQLWNTTGTRNSRMIANAPTSENSSGWKIITACRKPSLKILYFVHTAPKNFDKRQMLRKTIGDPGIASEVNSAVVFFVGVTPDLKERKTLLEEAANEGDLVSFNFMDTYKNLSHKFINGARWILDNCLLDAKSAIVKIDDDILVNVFALSSYLTSGAMAVTGMHCFMFKQTGPQRKKWSKWYVSRKAYASNVYPAYCTGAAVIMQPSVLLTLYNAASQVPFFWVDDVYVYGMIGDFANVTLVDISKYIVLRAHRRMPIEKVKPTVLFLHTGWTTITKRNIHQLWQKFKRNKHVLWNKFNKDVQVYYRRIATPTKK